MILLYIRAVDLNVLGAFRPIFLRGISPDNIISRMIFPNEFGMKKKQTDNDKIEPDPGSIWSKAKRARLARAKEQQCQAAEEPAQTED